MVDLKNKQTLNIKENNLITLEQLAHERLTRTHDIQVDLELIMTLKNRNSL